MVLSSFSEAEKRGWEAKAEGYADLLGEVTMKAAPSLLRAAGVQPGTHVLDLASGPGYVAAAAYSNRAVATGLDFAADMVALARDRHPGPTYVQGDAENLPFGDGTFDAVTCAFGVLHFSDPDRALSEVARVLKPGGRFAFSVWAGPERHEFFSIVTQAIAAHGDPDVVLPPAPPIFRFADPSESERAMRTAGFIDVVVSDLPLEWVARSHNEITDVIERSTVRTAMMIEIQPLDRRRQIQQAILDGAAKYMRDGLCRIAWPAVMTQGRKLE